MKRNGLLLIMFSFILMLAACGSENTQGESENENVEENASVEEVEINEEENIEDEGSISVTDLHGNTVEFDEAPKNIVALTAGDLETIYALDGEAVGRPVIRGEVPEYIKDIPEVGTTNEVNLEKIISLSPDLVIAHPQLNAKDMPLLEEVGIDVLFTGAETVDEIQSSIEMFGKVLQNEEKAAELVAEIDAKVADFQANTEEQVRALMVFGVPGNLMVALPDSLTGNMLETVGGYNIAHDFPQLDRFPQYAQLDVEKIVAADPEVILLVSPVPSEVISQNFTEEMEKSPIWKSVSAVENDNIIYLPNNLFGASPGAKITDSLDYLYEQIQGINK